MEDKQIVDMFCARNETAISELKKKYGNYCRYIACRVLGDERDAEEAENDAYLKAWNTIPPFMPENLSAYVGMLVRRSALDMLDRKNADKRRAGNCCSVEDELEDVISDENAGDFQESVSFEDVMNRFLASLGKKERIIFVRRYWYMSGIGEISSEMGMSENAVGISLCKTRKKLAVYLKKEGYSL